MKRPLGVTITVVWMALLLATLSVLAILSGEVATAVSVLAAAIALGRVVLGLWRGERWAYLSFRILLLVGFLVSLVLAFLPSRRHGPIYFGLRSAVMGAWAYYFFRPNVRAYFARER